MKKVFLFTMLATFGLTELTAQSDAGDFTLAPHLGVNLSSYLSSEADYGFRVGIGAGVDAEYYLSDRWSIRSGLLYQSRGAEDSFDNVDKLDYLSVPINAAFHFGGNRNWYLNFGPEVAFLMSAKAELADGSSFDIDEFISGTDVGLRIGIGYKFNVGDNIQLFIDHQEYIGFLNVVEDDVLPFSIQNLTGSFNFGAVFQL